MDAVRYSVGRSSKKSLRRRSQEHALLDKVNQILPLSSGWPYWSWYDCFLRLRLKMTWCNMNYHVSILRHLYISRRLHVIKNNHIVSILRHLYISRRLHVIKNNHIVSILRHLYISRRLHVIKNNHIVSILRHLYISRRLHIIKNNHIVSILRHLYISRRLHVIKIRHKISFMLSLKSLNSEFPFFREQIASQS